MDDKEVSVPQFDVKIEEKADLDLGKEDSSEDDQPEKEEV